MLGRYDNFPHVIHGTARFTLLLSPEHVQQAILEVTHQLNHQIYCLTDFSPFLKSNCQVSFEFGTAEGTTFNYLDNEELEKFQKRIETRHLRIIDIFCVVRYHALQASGRPTPLRFDYNMLRFTFSRKTMELLVSHQRGNRRISMEDLITFLMKKITEKLEEKAQKALVLKYLRTL